jgi:cyclophilin family peptidyl-prolyl cis-trans isomerase
MIRGAALLLVVFLSAAGPTAPPPDPLTAIMVAEDRRVDLPPGLHTPAIDTLRNSLDEDAKMLVELARSRDRGVQAAAIRALGRYERREWAATILQYLPLTTGQTSVAAEALAQSMRGDPLPLDVSGEQVQAVLEALTKVGEDSLNAPRPARFTGLGAIARAIGRLPFLKAEQVEWADSFLLLAMRRVDDDPGARVLLSPDIIRAVESLARQSGKLALPKQATIEWLRRIVTEGKYPASAIRNAMAVLVASRGLDEDAVRSLMRGTLADEEVRRLVVVALSGAGSPITGDERTRLLSDLLDDESLIVRVDAIRAWARVESAVNGCGPLFETLKDRDLPVVLVTIDTLGDACREDQYVTDRLTAEVRTPPDYAWHREAHALVSLARRAPDRAANPMPSFVGHSRWQVRLYAARAATIMRDLASLERLAFDSNPNVREAALPRLRLLTGAESDPAFVSALGMGDYQLLRTAANELKGATPTAAIVTALFDALNRTTAEQKETSRDTRLALLARVDELGGPDQVGLLVPFLEDYDIQVALAAAGIIQKWTGRPREIAPRLLPRPAPPTVAELGEIRRTEVRIKLASGRRLTMRLNPEVAPLTSVRVFRLARAGYYNGLTFHRIVPNFVIQGGSPGANEYAGDGPYVRDEIGRLLNERGTVGLSTRGRDTGDAQFYFNLIDNPRLDYEYTVFGTVGRPDVMDRILEGDTIESITFEKPDPAR